MKDNGSFTHFLFPNNERLFEGANVDVVVFRYEKGLECDKCLVNGKETLCNITKGIITFSEEKIEGELLENDFNVYVGIVSGKDEVYKVPFGNIEVLMDKNKLEKFIFIDKFPSNNEEIDTHLENNKNLLLERRIKKFTEKNWFEWGAPRNIKTIKENINKKCIYVRTMTRQKEIAFIDTVKYFGGTLLCLIPKNNISDNRLNSIIAYLNSEKFKKDYMYSGRFKIGHKQICNVHIPI
jgi:adenine-specific DNA-methyltransferase